jgi:hypothetical protein
MKKITLLLLAIAGLSGFGLSGLRAQSVDEIVNKYVDAIGGRKVLSGITSLVIESSVNVMGSDAPSVTHIINGKGFKSETDFNGAKIVNCITDKGGWAINPMAGQTTPTAIPAEQAKAGQGSYQVGGPLFDYATKGYKVELAGKDAADFQLKASGNGVTVTYYINANTYLIDKMVNKVNANGQELEITTSFRDYKKTDAGYIIAYTQEVTYPQFTVAITHSKVEVNTPVDASIFEMPK